MNSRTVVLFLVAAATSLAAPSSVASLSSDRFGTTPRGENPLLVALDINRDGILSAAEIAAAPLGLRAVDLDDDGVLAASELHAGSEAVALTSAFASRTHDEAAAVGFTLFFSLDANRDGTIQAIEVANAALSLARLDANRDGELSAAELSFMSGFARAG